MDTNSGSRDWSKVWHWLAPRLVPALLLGFGIGVAALLAYRSQQAAPPSAAESAFLVLASSALNVAGAVLIGRIGRADPRHARSAVRRLLAVGRDAGMATVDLQAAIERDDPHILLMTSIQVEARLLSMQLHLSDALQDWNDVHREALREVLVSETAAAPPEGEQS